LVVMLSCEAQTTTRDQTVIEMMDGVVSKI